MILARCVFVFKHLNFPTEVFLQYVCPCSFYLRTMRISGVVHPHDISAFRVECFFLMNPVVVFLPFLARRHAPNTTNQVC